MTRHDRFIHIVAACLEALEAGHTDIATCITSYPEYPQLGPLLALAADLWSLPLPARHSALASATDRRVRLAIERRDGEDAATPIFATPDPTLQRRRHPRVPVLLNGRLWVTQRESGDRRSIPITVTDLSAGGFGFEIAELLEPGVAVEIELHLPSARRARHEPASIVATLVRHWPRPAASRPMSTGRSRTAASLAALARVVHCGAPHGKAGCSTRATFRGGAEIVAPGDLVHTVRP